MENTNANGNKNGAKPNWKKPIEKEKYTEDEIELIKAGRTVMRVIEKQVTRGDFDHILKKGKAKK